MPPDPDSGMVAAGANLLSGLAVAYALVVVSDASTRFSAPLRTGERVTHLVFLAVVVFLPVGALRAWGTLLFAARFRESCFSRPLIGAATRAPSRPRRSPGLYPCRLFCSRSAPRRADPLSASMLSGGGATPAPVFIHAEEHAGICPPPPCPGAHTPRDAVVFLRGPGGGGTPGGTPPLLPPKTTPSPHPLPPVRPVRPGNCGFVLCPPVPRRCALVSPHFLYWFFRRVYISRAPHRGPRRATPRPRAWPRPCAGSGGGGASAEVAENSSC
jgi:hypothetical protein